MDQDRILYRGEAFTLTGNSLRQDAAHWAEVQPDGQVKTMKNGRYSEWRIFPEAGNAPHYRGNFEVLNQAYGLALHEAGALLNEEGTFRTGANWPTVWTRDISYSTHLGLGLWNVRACMNSLNARVRNGEVEQDTGTGGSWPISSDRVVWGMAAWEVYCLTGDADWLSLSCRVMEKTCMRDEQVLAATGGLMKGESSVLDWREQSYPAWMTSADIGDSCSLSTMLLHAEARKILARMFRELGLEEKAREWEEKSVSLAAVIERFFRIPEHVLYGQYLYGAGIPYCRRRWIPWAICFASFWGRLAVPMPPGWLPPFLMAFMAFPASIPRCLIACPPTITAPCGLSWRAIMRRPRRRWRMNLPWRWRSPAWSVPPCCAARTRKMSF